MKKGKKEGCCSKCGTTENVSFGNCEKCSLKMIEELKGKLKKMGIENEFEVEKKFIPELGKSRIYLKIAVSTLKKPS